MSTGIVHKSTGLVSFVAPAGVSRVVRQSTGRVAVCERTARWATALQRRPPGAALTLRGGGDGKALPLRMDDAARRKLNEAARFTALHRDGNALSAAVAAATVPLLTTVSCFLLTLDLAKAEATDAPAAAPAPQESSFNGLAEKLENVLAPMAFVLLVVLTVLAIFVFVLRQLQERKIAELEKWLEDYERRTWGTPPAEPKKPSPSSPAGSLNRYQRREKERQRRKQKAGADAELE
ncbi:hypothetical protein CDCA_CDCA09G2643 [Cyanidium caldarium]|uniref:Uncharacterized protein n=1 Tax=Cyanidium caldarium TaxID=2771 RepID=A0AAV9IX01_CYACA|nr:hypothetical protein CDCA_CDCA09G2643 [Cyanidium caldarium]|eukprot:ctg_667.g209